MTKKYSVRVPVTGIVTVIVPGQSEEEAVSNAYYAIEENQSLSIKSDDFQKIESLGFIEWDDPPRCTLIEDQRKPGAQEPMLQRKPGAWEPMFQRKLGAQEPMLQRKLGAQEPMLQRKLGAQEPMLQRKLGAQEPML